MRNLNLRPCKNTMDTQITQIATVYIINLFHSMNFSAHISSNYIPNHYQPFGQFQESVYIYLYFVYPFASKCRKLKMALSRNGRNFTIKY